MTISDTFNRANSSTALGTASDGGTWTIDGSVVFGITSNQAYCVNNAAQTARARRNTNQVDTDVSLDTTYSVASRLQIWFAYDPATTTGYFLSMGSSASVLKTADGGTSTTGIGSSFAVPSSGQTVRVTYNHATGVIVVTYNGTTAATVTDGTPITATANSWVGFGATLVNSSTGQTWDNFSATSTAVPVALTAAVTQEQVLAGGALFPPVAVTGAISREDALAATVTVVEPFAAGLAAEHTLTASLTSSEPLSAWLTDDEERTDFPLELWGMLDVDPLEVDPPAGVDYIQVQQASVTMPTPTLVPGTGHPNPDVWQPSINYVIWAQKLQLVIGGVDRSWLRGKQFIPISDASVEPFGDAEARFALPGLSEFDNPAAFGLTPLTSVSLRRKDLAGHWHTLYEGDLASLEPDQGQGPEIACIGAIMRLDLLKEPPTLLVQATDLGRLIPQAVNDKRRRYNVNLNTMPEQTTGIQGTGDAGSFKPFLTGFVQDYLATAGVDNGSQWTVAHKRPRTPVLQLKNMTTVKGTVSYGAPGVDVKLSQDFTSGTTAVYGNGTNGHDAWEGARFPNLTQGAVPTYPLAPGVVFVAGDGHTGFAPFSNFMRRGHYGQISSDDTYSPDDVDSVEQFQSRAGITVDGVVGAQTWEAAFQPGANQGSMRGAYIGTIYELAATRRRKYNAQGADVGANPSYDPTVPRIEDYIPFGDNVPKRTGVASARQIIDRNYPAGLVGTITLTSDPTECSRFDLDAGMNIKVKNYKGADVVLHITRRDRDWRNAQVSLTVDEKARDDITRAMIHQRNKDIADLVRRPHHGRTRSRVFNDYGTWLTEDGAGHIPLMNQQGGFWNVQRIAAARRGSIERISLALGTGLTEHLLNRNESSSPPASIPGAARGCVAIFAQPITANNLNRLPGLATPLTDTSAGLNPWDVNNDELVNFYGLIYAAGGPGAAIGFYPNNDPGDGTDTNLTGRFEDGASVQFGPNNYFWLWVAIWCPTSCIVGGRIFPGAPS